MKRLIKAFLTFTLSVASAVCAAEQIIVYRSRAEAEMDAFFWDNPEMVLWGFAILGGGVALTLFCSWMNSRRNRWRN